MRSHKETAAALYFDTSLYLLFVLYKDLMMDSFNPKHVTKAYEKEYMMCSKWRFILLSFELITQQNLFY
jgi:hypothetical protein